ncbi:unnamed protein product, partial [Iphiclides podalirius]
MGRRVRGSETVSRVADVHGRRKAQSKVPGGRSQVDYISGIAALNDLEGHHPGSYVDCSVTCFIHAHGYHFTSGEPRPRSPTFHLNKRIMTTESTYYKSTLSLEYLPNADLEVIQGLDDKMYEDLMNEIPILRQVIKGNRKNKTLRLETSALPFVFGEGEVPKASSAALGNYANSTAVGGRRLPYRTRWPSNSRLRSERTSPARRGGPDTWPDITFTAFWRLVYPYLISCFWCGLNETLLPQTSLCHDVFDSDDGDARKMWRFFRARCFYYDRWRYYDRQFQNRHRYPPFVVWKWDVGLKKDMFGPYMHGCFKRYVDVGPLYTSRGCRGRFLPWRSYTRDFAAHRLMRLELVARGHADVCVHSPYASLTPFSRSVSLFVRYHVCVCDTRYCNLSAPPAPPPPLPTLLLLHSYMLLFQ